MELILCYQVVACLLIGGSAVGQTLGRPDALEGEYPHAPPGGVETLGHPRDPVSVSCGDVSGQIIVYVGSDFWTSYPSPNGTDPPLLLRRPNGVSLAFESPSGSETSCCWLQFAWVEATYSGTPNGRPRSDNVSLDWAIPTPSGDIHMTMPGAPPNLFVDSANPRDETNACYDPGGASLPRRIGNPSTTILDMPAAPVSTIADSLGRSNIRVHEVNTIQHFESYLVCGGDVCAKVEWSTRYRWTPENGTQGPSHRVRSEESPATLSDEHRRVLASNFPNQTTLRPGGSR